VESTREIFLKELKCRELQGEEEFPIAYYYDVMNICRIMDKTIDEKTKLDHLYQGLNQLIFTSVYVRKPDTCKEFLCLLKLHAEAGDMTRKNELRVAAIPT